MPILSILLPLIIAIAGLLIGILFQKIIISRIARVAAKTKWKGDNIIIAAIKGPIVFWFLAIGIYVSLQFLSLSPNLANILQKVLLILIILSITLVLARIVAGFVQMSTSGVKGALPSTTIFTNLTKIFILVIGVLIILQTLGISITPLITAFGIGGLAVALALQDTLANLFAGIHILISKQVRIGDYVRLETGEKGYVTDIKWRNTTIRMLPNNTVVVPNSKLASIIVTNYYLPEQELAVLIQVGVSYDSDLEKAERVTIEVAEEVMKEVSGGIPEFKPFIRYHTFDDFSINFTVILRAKEFVDNYLIKHEFIKRLHKRYKEEGIVIPFPIRTVYMRESEIQNRKSRD